MSFSNLLNGLIALVLVLLLLSMIVQSTQDLLKRLCRVKARQLDNALDALFAKAGLCCPAEKRLSFTKSVAGDFGRTGAVASARSAAQEVSKKEILLWLSGQPVGGSLDLLHSSIDAVERILRQQPSGDAAATFAKLQAFLRPFLSSLPSRSDAFTYRHSRDKTILPMEMVMRTVDELRSMKSPPNQIDELPARLTEVLEEWRKLVAPAKRIETGIEDWFETTTAAFRERYEQEMKRWCLALSIVVAVSLDANFFRFANEAFQPNPDVAAGLKLIDLDKIRHPFTAEGFKQLTGWFVTSLLLSTGAPFWQDALQSLFGLKNFLRKPAEATLDGRLI